MKAVPSSELNINRPSVIGLYQESNTGKNSCQTPG